MHGSTIRVNTVWPFIFGSLTNSWWILVHFLCPPEGSTSLFNVAACILCCMWLHCCHGDSLQGSCDAYICSKSTCWLWGNDNLLPALHLLLTLSHLHRDPNMISQLASFSPLHFNIIWIALNCSYLKRCMIADDRGSLFLWLIKSSWESLHGGTLMCLLANASPVESFEELNQRWMTCQISDTHTHTHTSS